jgi:beta-glucosidase
MAEAHWRFTAPDAEVSRRVDDLLGRMTLDEKVGQMTQSGRVEGLEEQIKAGGIGSILTLSDLGEINRLQKIAVEESRLGIPIIYGYDVIHGLRTVFPIPLAEACTWDPDLLEEAARIAATEAACNGFHWIFAPMVDVARDPRWGRVAEGGGEDPYLGAALARARVRGFQAEGLPGGRRIVACPKHYVAYGAAEAGKDYNTTDMSERTLRDLYLPPFKAAFDEGAGSVMSAFNEISGVPTSANAFTLRTVLRDEWDWPGVVLSDYNALGELIPHGIAADLKEAAAKAALAGVDMDMMGHAFPNHLADLVREGIVPESLVDEAVRRILALKVVMGLFEQPYTDESLSARYVLREDYRQKALEVAIKSMVLLRNEGDLLPLSPSTQKIAVIGPLADDAKSPLGCWAWQGKPEDVDTVLAAIRATSQGDVVHARGCDVEAPKLDEYGIDWRRVKLEDLDLGDVDLRAFGVPLSMIDTGMINLGVVIDQLKAAGVDLSSVNFEAIARAQHESAVAPEVEIEAAAKVARKADVAVLVLGETDAMSGEAHSRAYLDLPGRQQQLLEAVVSTGTPVVLVVLSGRPLALTWAAGHVPAILQSWHGGIRHGRAVADILFGKANPSGKLVSTFPRTVGQIPVYYAHKSTGRPATGAGTKQFQDPFRSNYIDETNAPLYPFGYGLSYTCYEYANLVVETPQITADGELVVTAEVANTGECAGDEVVQLYVRDLVGSVTRPVKELKGFQTVSLQPGQRVTVRFVVPAAELGFYGLDNRYVVEPGAFKVWVAPNSAQGLEGDFEIAD